ncbi:MULTISPECIES: thioredoxin family protein [unclassified Fusibacter]|uniref:thioredoxin family protein n=1 Tax=unclassified Fusibacter TaxID=2624464 RepID=UPI0019D715A0|nr:MULTISPECIES: thioredoxin family protein [unclassified Fusibacter]MCK8059271.1 thioredoxin family protein [Fusibacter sp. A2]
MRKLSVLGSGCKKCNDLEASVKNIAAAKQWDVEIEKITDYPTILGMGVIKTPALALDGKILFSGLLPSEKKLEKLLEKHF